MSAIGVIATLTVAEGKNEAFEAVFADLAAAVRANEPGNVFYTLTRSRSNRGFKLYSASRYSTSGAPARHAPSFGPAALK